MSSLRKKLIDSGIESSMLDYLVHDSAQKEVSRINNEGMKVQLNYLVKSGMSEDQILQELGVSDNNKQH